AARPGCGADSGTAACCATSGASSPTTPRSAQALRRARARARLRARADAVARRAPPLLRLPRAVEAAPRVRRRGHARDARTRGDRDVTPQTKEPTRTAVAAAPP